jgi:hypothetical protein
MAFQQIDIDILNSQYMFHSRLRNERIYLFGPLVLSCWYYENHVLVNYTDGTSEQIPTPFTTQMEIDYGEETKMNEEEELPHAGGAVAIDVDEEDEPPQAQHPNMVTDDEDEEDDTDNEEPDDDEYIVAPEPVDMN